MGQPKHILAVDDNEMVREVIVTMLQEHGYQVTASDGGASMREILQRDEAVDAIVLDALMPGERSAALALHARTRGIPVVMVSGSPDMIESARANGLQMLQKPFRSRELIDALLQAFDSGEAGQRVENRG